MFCTVTYIYGEQKGEKIQHGFEKSSESYIESIDSNVVIYEHLGTGAQAIYVKNNDPNQVFAIGFKTPIHDNTGVNHIVEHAVFTGSQKYNIKDVFFEMKKRSPSIYMNASTAVDMTIYPFSTRSHKDYRNLLDVYLDAVFFPNLQKQRYGFDQEGWHYTIDQDEKFHLNGVVYNEMKGASVIPRRILAMANRSAMFPDTMYIYNAGGNPDEIPKLTYEEFKNTHEAYYVPSNSCAFIYGNVEIDEILATLDQYYSQFKKQKTQNISQKQVSFEKMKYYKADYPVTGDDNGYFISTNYAVGDMGDIKLQLSMEILMDMLVQYEGSPLKKAFNNEQKSKTLSYDIDGSIPQPMYSFIATDVKEKDIQKVEAVIQETLSKVAEDGLKADIIKMAINQYELREKQRISNISKGIDMAYGSLYSWGHDVPILDMLQKHQYIDEIKKEGNSLYFQRLIQKYMVDNTHSTRVRLGPNKNYITDAREEELKSVGREALGTSPEEKRTIIEKKIALEKWQKENHPLWTLPELKLEDINQSVSLPQLTIKDHKNSRIMYYTADTNDLIYTDLYFDTSYIPQESLYELFLYAYLIGEMEKDSVDLYTGGLTASTLAIPAFEEPSRYDPKLKLSICVEKENIQKAFQILEDITTKQKTWDQQWLGIQINKIRAQYENYFSSNPLDMMAVAINNTEDGASRYEYENMLPFYHYIRAISDDYDQYKEKIVQKLEAIDQSVFNKQNVILGATLQEENIKSLEKVYQAYFKKLGNQTYPKITYNFDMKEKRQGFPISSDVQYVVWGGNYKKAGGTYNGSLYVLANILNAEYMLKNARVKNGAYGAGIKFDPYGDIMLYTYQDPKLTQTLEIIQGVPKYIQQLNVQDDMLDAYKIGALSKFEEQLGLNENPRVIGETLQKYYLSGMNNEIIEKVRKDIFATTMEDIKGHGPVIERMIEEKRYSIAGSENKLLTNKKHFDIIQSFHKMYNCFSLIY